MIAEAELFAALDATPVPETPEAWCAAGEEILHAFFAATGRFGATPDLRLTLVRGVLQNPYYEPESWSLALGMPDATTLQGRLYWLAAMRLYGLASVRQTQAAVCAMLPWIISHEGAHHLRHACGAPNHDDFVEEQVCNFIAIGFVREHHTFRARIPLMQSLAQRAAAKLKEQAPQAMAHLSGYRLSVVGAAEARGALASGEAALAARLSALLQIDEQDVALQGGWLAAEEAEKARQAQEGAQAYFNTVYTTSLYEYFLFGNDWLAAHFERDENPSLRDCAHRFLTPPAPVAEAHAGPAEDADQGLHAADAPTRRAAALALLRRGTDADLTALAALREDPALPVRRLARRAALRRPFAGGAEEASLRPSSEELSHALRAHLALLQPADHAAGTAGLVAEAFYADCVALARSLLAARAREKAHRGAAELALLALDHLEGGGRAVALGLARGILEEDGEAPGALDLLAHPSPPHPLTLAAPGAGNIAGGIAATFLRLINTPPGAGAMLSFPDRIQTLKACELFRDLAIADLTELAQAFSEEHFGAQEQVFAAGEPGERIYVIASGDAEVKTASGQVLASLSRGDCFGEMALFDAAPRSATVTATSPLATLTMTRDEFRACGYDNPAILFGVIRLLSQRLRGANARSALPASAPA